MIIDFHTHVFPDKIADIAVQNLERNSGLSAQTNGRLNGLEQSMKESGIDCSIVLPVVTSVKQLKHVNESAASINKKYEKADIPKVISFGGIHPDIEYYKDVLKELKQEGFIGVKVHPDQQGVVFDDIRYKRIVSYAAELNMLVTVHAGVDIGLPNPVHCTPVMAANVLKETQTDTLILAHLGGWKYWDQVEEYLVGTKAYLDTSFLASYIERLQFERIVKNHGEDKILFGTDSPWSEQKGSIRWIEESGLSYETKEKIFWKNAIKLQKRG